MIVDFHYTTATRTASNIFEPMLLTEIRTFVMYFLLATLHCIHNHSCITTLFKLRHTTNDVDHAERRNKRQIYTPKMRQSLPRYHQHSTVCVVCTDVGSTRDCCYAIRLNVFVKMIALFSGLFLTVCLGYNNI